MSSPEVYDLIYSIFNNQTFSELHPTFYKLLSTLESDSRIVTQMEDNFFFFLEN